MPTQVQIPQYVLTVTEYDVLFVCFNPLFLIRIYHDRRFVCT